MSYYQDETDVEEHRAHDALEDLRREHEMLQNHYDEMERAMNRITRRFEGIYRLWPSQNRDLELDRAVRATVKEIHEYV